jgi:uncharacterized RDD family membrane protein YckC
MPRPASFVAAPRKRIAAFVYDSFAIIFTFMVLAVVAESVGHDLSTFAVFVTCAFAYHYAFLAFREGRTLGKAAQDICVVTVDGRAPRQWQALARPAIRYAPLLLLSLSTRDWVVSEALLGLAFKILAALLWLGECSLLTGSPTRQTIADRLARTLVVNTPTWEPHKAPAIPMYSATDAEFGHPPKRPPSERSECAARPNPSIERTAHGKPWAAAHVKR